MCCGGVGLDGMRLDEIQQDAEGRDMAVAGGRRAVSAMTGVADT